MNILTKILIVVTVVLIIIATPLVIQLVNVAPNYKRAYEAARSETAVLKTRVQMDRQLAERQKAEYDRLLARQEMDARQTAAKIDNLTAENARLAADNARNASRLEQMNASLTSLQASVAEQTQMNAVLSDQLRGANEDLQQLNAQLRDTTLRAQEYARDLETARQNARVNRDLLAAAEARIGELEERLAARGVAIREDPSPIPPTAIHGRLTQVSVEDGVAQLNVGAASGVREGMRFYLYRGTTYVGDLTVAQVEPNDSAGILSNLQVQPLPQDRATTDLTAD